MRDARPEDAFEIAGVHVRAWQAAYRGLLPGEYLDGLRAEDRMTHYNFDDGRPGHPTTIVAVADATIWGFATTGPALDHEAAGTGQIYAFYVDPQMWGRGAGRSLMAEAQARLRRQGFGAALLWVLAGNKRAENFYQAHGWQPDGQRREQEVWGAMADEICYRRDLHLPGDDAAIFRSLTLPTICPEAQIKNT
jgi:ribosomal protein S18 acetylase RimI-like enzyme